MRFRCAHAIDDDLHRFAAVWVAAGLVGTPRLVAELDGARVERIFRDGAFQIERCTVPANYRIPEHTHPEADTIEVGVSGAVRLSVNGVDPFAGVRDARLGAFTHSRGIRINACDVHGGQALADGAVFLSIQRWTGSPQSVLTSYCGEPLGPEHGALL